MRWSVKNLALHVTLRGLDFPGSQGEPLKDRRPELEEDFSGPPMKNALQMDSHR